MYSNVANCPFSIRQKQITTKTSNQADKNQSGSKTKRRILGAETNLGVSDAFGGALEHEMTRSEPGERDLSNALLARLRFDILIQQRTRFWWNELTENFGFATKQNLKISSPQNFVSPKFLILDLETF